MSTKFYKSKGFTLLLFVFLLITSTTLAQTTIRGTVYEAATNDPIIGANIIVQDTPEGTTIGTVSDWDGTFEFSTDETLPLSLKVSYTGFATQIVEVSDEKRLTITMEEDAQILEVVEVKGSRISDKQKESPLTIEALDIIAIKETPAANFYDGLGALKGVDLTAASLGFKVVNTRGFNSTSPVRSLQTIDGIDNQAPGLNFSLGNFLGSSELDVNKVEIVVGASSAFYGPNAFNGVIAMETKDPFFNEGLSAMVKVGERNMANAAVRWADVIKNKKDQNFFAYKFNLEYLRADDWIANNYDPIDGSRVNNTNTGGWDAVNIYGDEYQSGNDFSSLPLSQSKGQGIWYRTGYREEDLVDYDTRNLKANVALHFRTQPEMDAQSPEVIVSTNYGTGTTVYQGDNRFSLKGITFLQNRVEFRKKNKFFIRAFTTRTGAGESYDPYFTALQLQENAKSNFEWTKDYNDYWLNTIHPRIDESEFPRLMVDFDPTTGMVVTSFDVDGAEQWLQDNSGLLTEWQAEAAAFANGPGQGSSTAVAFFEPGTERFEEEFNNITGALRGEGGTRFFDNSALYHAHGEYIFTPTWTDKITVGANYRLYTPVSKGTVFSDTADVKITNSEVGFYGGIEKSFLDKKMKASFAIRADKNQNFDWLVSPAASLVWTPSQNNFFRISFSSAIRNPTLSDQYLYLDVGRATLTGNINGAQDLITVESLVEYFKQPMPGVLDSFDVLPVRPENVKTFEAGFRTTLFDQLYVDAGYYFSIYDNFLGFNLGVDAEFENGIPTRLEVFRFAANSNNTVTTQGFSIGLNYYLWKNYSLNGNYSWNRLNKSFEDDPIIPAFNTPEHKFNIGFGGRNLTIPLGGSRIKNFSFNINYKWIEGFIFEGSPQFTGNIPTYDMLDAQISLGIPKINSSIKIGASNILNNRTFQTYGGPRIGRLAYVTFTYQQ